MWVQQMRRFKSTAHVQLFASVHGLVQHLFRVSRHLLRSAHHHMLLTFPRIRSTEHTTTRVGPARLSGDRGVGKGVGV